MLTATTKTRHIEQCKRVFKNYDLTCLRCLELIAGDTPRPSWNSPRLAREARTLDAIRTHYVNGKPKCGNVVCTCFEW